MKVVDSKGNKYSSIAEAARAAHRSDSHFGKAIHINGSVTADNVVYRFDGDTEAESLSEDSVWVKLKERYSEKELKLLLRGEGLVSHNEEIQIPKFEGKHYKFLVMSDTHLGSKYSLGEWLPSIFQEAKESGCQFILHCGDLVDGLCPSRAKTHIYELDKIGYKAQKDYAISLFRECELPIYIISGNHDAWYTDMGANIVEDICNAIPNMMYLGHDQADILLGHAKVRLFHGGDANSYAHSYRLQKIVESYMGGDKPNLLFAGHVHKMCYIFERNIHALDVPCLQRQSAWMKSKKIAAHMGYLIVEFDSCEDQPVMNFTVTNKAYYFE